MSAKTQVEKEKKGRGTGGEFEQVSCLIRNPKKRLNCWLYNMQQSLSSKQILHLFGKFVLNMQLKYQGLVVAVA